MLTQKELQEIINQKKLPVSIPRLKYTDKIFSWLKRKEIIILKGIRRSGKTHIMYQIIKKLPKKNTFYVNFDDFRLDSYLNLNLLEEIVKLREPNKKSYFFFDEIQRIKGFEKWLRTYYDKETNIKFIIGGSNISLLSPEMGTVLTGRNISFVIYPLSYDEFKIFSQHSFDVYLKYGGFPEIVLENDKNKKKELLEQYISDIIARDIISKYKIENPRQFQALIKIFLANPGVSISANKLSKQLEIHKDTAQKYISYIIDSFIIFEVPFFSYSAKTKYIGTHASKYYVIDNGFHTTASIKENQSILYENLIAINLLNDKKEIMYWKNNSEIDFIHDKTAIQVTATNKIPKRETNAFLKFELEHKNFKRILVCPDKKQTKDNINFIPIKEFLLK